MIVEQLFLKLISNQFIKEGNHSKVTFEMQLVIKKQSPNGHIFMKEKNYINVLCSNALVSYPT